MRVALGMAAGHSWDDADFELSPLPAADEEAFIHAPMTQEDEGGDDLIDEGSFPVLIVNLAPLAAADDMLRGEFGAVRQVVLSALERDWTAKVSELMAAGMCWHAPRRESSTWREDYERAHPGSMLSVIEYPSHVEKVRTASLWRAVTRSTPWEVVDLLKAHIARCRRPLKFQADLAIELEELAEKEARTAEACDAARAQLRAASSEREAALAAMHAKHAAQAPGVPDAAEDVSDAAAALGDMSRMVAELDSLDVQLKEKVAEAEAVEAEAAEGAAPESGEVPSLLDVILDVIFKQYDDDPSAEAKLEPPPPPLGAHQTPGAPPAVDAQASWSASWSVHAVAVSTRKRELVRTWQSTFGRLPAASDMVLKHAPQGATRASHMLPPKEQKVGRPRMLVPPPVAVRPPPGTGAS